MGCDAVVALGRATLDGKTFLAHNSDLPPDRSQTLVRIPGRYYTLGERVPAQFLQLPQVRQTCTVLASQPEGVWGYCHGVNEHRVAIGQTSVSTRLASEGPGLIGTDLVRLGLERAHSAHQAIDVITDLIQRHGMGGAMHTSSDEHDATLLIADPKEAYALETAGRYFVIQEIQQVRAASNVCLIRQDWDRISPGLAAAVIERQWWPEDGSKVDFAGAVVSNPVGRASALRRWGRATLLLEQQNGHIDTAFLRRLLSDHYEGMHSEVDPLASANGPTPLCQHPGGRHEETTSVSMVAQLSPRPAEPVVAWLAFGPPCTSVYFPVLLEADLPTVDDVGSTQPTLQGCCQRMTQLLQQLHRDPPRWQLARESFSRLQALFDQETEEFLVEAASLREKGADADVQRLAGILMEHHLEQFDSVWQSLYDRRAALQPLPSA